jgi:polyhydroxyalkanoate synthesis regulator phasin
MESRENRFAGFGWLERSQERVEEYVEELVERGELKRKDSRHFIKRVMEQARGEREEFRTIMREILTDTLSAAGVATQAELAELNARLERLEKKVKQSVSGGGPPVRRKAPAKKPAGKKSVKSKAAAKPSAGKPASATAKKTPGKKPSGGKA